MGLRGVRVKGGKTRDIPLPSAVMNFLTAYIERVLRKEMEIVEPDTPLFWSGSASLLGHARIDTTQIYTSIKQSQLKRAVSFYETKATKMLSEWGRAGVPGSRNRAMFLKHGTKNTNEIHLVAPPGHDRTCIIQLRDFIAR